MLSKLRQTFSFFQAGAMDRARQTQKIRDAEKESLFGYVYAVSGPGKEYLHDP